MIDANTFTLMVQELDGILHQYFNLLAIRKVDHPFHSVLMFQNIHVAAVNLILSEESIIASAFTRINAMRPNTMDQIIEMINNVQTYSIAFKIMGFRDAFCGGVETQVLTQVQDAIQSGIPSLPFSIQTEENAALTTIHKLIVQRTPVDTNVINNILLPIYAKASNETSSSTCIFCKVCGAYSDAQLPGQHRGCFLCLARLLSSAMTAAITSRTSTALNRARLHSHCTAAKILRGRVSSVMAAASRRTQTDSATLDAQNGIRV
jgi:hypothetical protein